MSLLLIQRLSSATSGRMLPEAKFYCAKSQPKLGLSRGSISVENSILPVFAEGVGVLNKDDVKMGALMKIFYG
jgi:hypothetical protein